MPVNPFLPHGTQKSCQKKTENGDERTRTIAEVVAARTNKNKYSSRDARITIRNQHTNHLPKLNGNTQQWRIVFGWFI